MRLERGVESFYSYHKIWGSPDSHRVGGNLSLLLALSSSQSSQQRVIIIIERETAVRSQIKSDLFFQIPESCATVHQGVRRNLFKTVPWLMSPPLISIVWVSLMFLLTGGRCRVSNQLEQIVNFPFPFEWNQRKRQIHIINLKSPFSLSPELLSPGSDEVS